MTMSLPIDGMLSYHFSSHEIVTMLKNLADRKRKRADDVEKNIAVYAKRLADPQDRMLQPVDDETEFASWPGYEPVNGRQSPAEAAKAMIRELREDADYDTFLAAHVPAVKEFYLSEHEVARLYGRDEMSGGCFGGGIRRRAVGRIA